MEQIQVPIYNKVTRKYANSIKLNFAYLYSMNSEKMSSQDTLWEKWFDYNCTKILIS